MKDRLKQYLLMALIAAAAYFVLNNHIIFDGWKEVYLLKKSSLHLHYSFYSIKQKKPETIMKVDILREAGIGDLLVELGKMSADQKIKLESKFERSY